MAKKAKKKVSKKAVKPNLDIEIDVDTEPTGQAISLAIAAMVMDRRVFRDAIKDILNNKEEIGSVWEALETIHDRSNKFNKQLKDAMKFMRKNRTQSNIQVKAIKNLKLGKED
ncbi:MAG: hypothetical protein A2Y07_07125 [Planctomycetes bacterium GWF2_50_10]|nr:MAG: hypothetical protein A2Y07_07125 [Planctomycetes bacterium GWF2_50_10]